VDFVFLKIRAILSDLFDIEADNLLPTSNLVDDLGLDSLDLVELMMYCEDEFNINIADDAVSGLERIEDICLYVQEYYPVQVAQMDLPDGRSAKPNLKEYDEDAILTSYVWRYYNSQMTSFEHKAGGEILRSMKAESYAKGDAEKLEKLKIRFGLNKDPEVTRALNVGYEEYRKQVRVRLLNERSTEIFINRCPECNRIVRTPNAKQCLWCGCSWRRSD
jgi:acyl carrier protein